VAPAVLLLAHGCSLVSSLSLYCWAHTLFNLRVPTSLIYLSVRVAATVVCVSQIVEHVCCTCLHVPTSLEPWPVVPICLVDCQHPPALLCMHLSSFTDLHVPTSGKPASASQGKGQGGKASTTQQGLLHEFEGELASQVSCVVEKTARAVCVIWVHQHSRDASCAGSKFAIPLQMAVSSCALVTLALMMTSHAAPISRHCAECLHLSWRRCAVSALCSVFYIGTLCLSCLLQSLGLAELSLC
jgi:hypothetical protein